MFNDYICSSCGESCYYDGRCGDGPILICKCKNAKAIDRRYHNDDYTDPDDYYKYGNKNWV